MKKPTLEQFDTVIDNFKSVLPLAKLENHLNMDETTVVLSIKGEVKHVCGTIHCHAGWYAVSKVPKELVGQKTTSKPKDPDESCLYVGFSLGAHDLSTDLGFGDPEKLEEFFICHHELWGNDEADGMFCTSSAFTSPDRPNGARNLTDIINHWIEVRNRCHPDDKPMKVITNG